MYLVFDTETTGVDVLEDRIVQFFAMTMADDGKVLDTWEWIINPGVDVPEGASDIHGFTTEFLKENGVDPLVALDEIWDLFYEHADLTWVAYNLNYDLSILHAEFDRNHIDYYWGHDRIKGVRMLDPLVVDRARDKYRKGNRKLESVAPHYGIAFDKEAAHKADYDVEITGKVAIKVVEKFGMPTNAEQAKWYAAWADNLQKYLRGSKDPEAVVDGAWPLRLKDEK